MRLSELHPSLSREEQAELANQAGTNEGYLWQLATQWRGKKPSLNLLSRLVAADGRLTVADLVDEFADSRPELIGKPGAPSITTQGAASA